MQVAKVVRRPRSQQLRERDHAEGRMAPTPFEVLRVQIQSFQLSDADGAQLGKLGQQPTQGARIAKMSLTLEGRERLRLARSKKDLHTWQPVRSLTMDEVGEHVGDRPGARALVAMRKRFWQRT
jgi:hypothetical protein